MRICREAPMLCHPWRIGTLPSMAPEERLNAAYPLWYASENLTRYRGKDHADAADVFAREYNYDLWKSIV
jgi:hypothetical protein